jgi:hypothetical protein
MTIIFGRASDHLADCERIEEGRAAAMSVKEKERRASLEAFAVPWLKAR